LHISSDSKDVGELCYSSDATEYEPISGFVNRPISFQNEPVSEFSILDRSTATSNSLHKDQPLRNVYDKDTRGATGPDISQQSTVIETKVRNDIFDRKLENSKENSQTFSELLRALVNNEGKNKGNLPISSVNDHALYGVKNHQYDHESYNTAPFQEKSKIVQDPKSEILKKIDRTTGTDTSYIFQRNTMDDPTYSKSSNNPKLEAEKGNVIFDGISKLSDLTSASKISQAAAQIKRTTDSITTNDPKLEILEKIDGTTGTDTSYIFQRNTMDDPTYSKSSNNPKLEAEKSNVIFDGISKLSDLTSASKISQAAAQIKRTTDSITTNGPKSEILEKIDGTTGTDTSYIFQRNIMDVQTYSKSSNNHKLEAEKNNVIFDGISKLSDLTSASKISQAAAQIKRTTDSITTNGPKSEILEKIDGTTGTDTSYIFQRNIMDVRTYSKSSNNHKLEAENNNVIFDGISKLSDPTSASDISQEPTEIKRTTNSIINNADQGNNTPTGKFISWEDEYNQHSLASMPIELEQSKIHDSNGRAVNTLYSHNNTNSNYHLSEKPISEVKKQEFANIPKRNNLSDNGKQVIIILIYKRLFPEHRGLIQMSPNWPQLKH
jgi:hypothetical protein